MVRRSLNETRYFATPRIHQPAQTLVSMQWSVDPKYMNLTVWTRSSGAGVSGEARPTEKRSPSETDSKCPPLMNILLELIFYRGCINTKWNSPQLSRPVIPIMCCESLLFFREQAAGIQGLNSDPRASTAHSRPKWSRLIPKARQMMLGWKKLLNYSRTCICLFYMQHFLQFDL